MAPLLNSENKTDIAASIPCTVSNGVAEQHNYECSCISSTKTCGSKANINHHHSRPPIFTSYGSTDEYSTDFNRLTRKAWSFQDKTLNERLSSVQLNSSDPQKIRSLSRGESIGALKMNDESNESYRSIYSGQSLESPSHPLSARTNSPKVSAKSKSFTINEFIFALIYALVNVVISVPALYGYSAVIFSDGCYQKHMNALSKLVIFSSAIHQIVFCFSSSLPFAISTVQDAGLIFLNTMSTRIAKKILEQEGGTIEEVVSTSLVLLSLSTALLGLVLILLGHFKLADAVSYLPMPVVGGYLAFIGYFCVTAGVSLCISKNITSITDWTYLFEGSSLLLAGPGLAAGLLLTLLSRYVKHDAALPLAMVALPTAFYGILFVFDINMEDARNAGWLGSLSPPVPAKDLLSLVDFSLVRWDLAKDIFPTWIGMVFVVSFASCLDVAAISMDMGKALDTNKELTTVGIGNFFSGMMLGFTGSYIFSQTIFTYRTGVHSRWIGVFIVGIFGYVVLSPVNVLEISPLFFLGSTLIFIGYDLLYEWLVDIRERIFLSEYFIILGTFVAIQAVGMDAGIVIGVLFSIVDHVVHTATTTGVYRTSKQSRATWSKEELKLLQSQIYNHASPKIIALEIVGSVFFGSSLLISQRIADEIGIDFSSDDPIPVNNAYGQKSPRAPTYFTAEHKRLCSSDVNKENQYRNLPPQFVVLDLTRVTNLDASAARGCFLQLAKVAHRHGIVVAGCACTVHIEWMLRSHGVAYDLEEEENIKSQFRSGDPNVRSERLLLFLTIHEALQFCERTLVLQMSYTGRSLNESQFSMVLNVERQTVGEIFSRILGSSSEERSLLKSFDGKRYHHEICFAPGDEIFCKNSMPDGFCVVLHGAVAAAISSDDPRHQVYRLNSSIMSGAGRILQKKSCSMLIESSVDDNVVVASMWPVGGVFGYVDFMLDRPRNFTAVATQEGTIIAKITKIHMRLLKSENPLLDGCLQRVLLQASLLDLQNCSCDE